jgi:hypothetical protein
VQLSNQIFRMHTSRGSPGSHRLLVLKNVCIHDSYDVGIVRYYIFIRHSAPQFFDWKLKEMALSINPVSVTKIESV